MIRNSIALIFIALLPLPAAAAEITSKSAIQSVTVFAEGAAVVRKAPVVFPAGWTTVIVDDLPADIEADSLRVDGSADSAITIASVETRVLPADPDQDQARKALNGEIQAVQDRLDGVADHIAALEQRRAFIARLADAASAGFGRALSTDGPGVEQWTAASQAIGSELTAVGDALRQLHVEERGIRRDLEKRQKDLALLPLPRAHTVVRIEVSTVLRALGSLTIGYRVPSAHWVPAYDALLSTGEADGKPKLTIIRRAEVTQATGEDWTAVAMTLSTARPAGGVAAPEIQPSLVSLAPSYPDGSLSSESRSAPSAKPDSDAFADDGRLEKDKAAIVQEAAADFGDFRAEYRVAGTVSVQSGVGARSLRIASEAVDAALEVRAVPALSPFAYLHARLTAPAGAPLLAGRVSLFRDGSYVGLGGIGFTNAGATLDLGFGSDDRVKVTRTALARETGETGLLSARKTDTRHFRITVENLHAQAITVTVLDRIPYAEDEKITVERLAGTTPPTAENVDDRRGVVAWTYAYRPGESRSIESAYKLTWPAHDSVIVAD